MPAWIPEEWRERYRRYSNHCRSRHHREPCGIAHYLLHVTPRPVPADLRTRVALHQERERSGEILIARARRSLGDLERRPESLPEPVRLKLAELVAVIVSVGQKPDTKGG